MIKRLLFKTDMIFRVLLSSLIIGIGLFQEISLFWIIPAMYGILDFYDFLRKIMSHEKRL